MHALAGGTGGATGEAGPAEAAESQTETEAVIFRIHLSDLDCCAQAAEHRDRSYTNPNA